MPYKDPEAARVHGQRYREENADAVRTRKALYYQLNRERLLAEMKADYAATRAKPRAPKRPPEERQAYKHAWYLANKDRRPPYIPRPRPPKITPEERQARQKIRLHRYNTSPEHRAADKRYRAANPDKVKETQAKYEQAHPDFYREWRTLGGQRRQARLLGLPHTLTDGEWSSLLDLFEYSCAYCGGDNNGRTLHREHVIPVSRGGGFTVDNIVPACHSCNSRKHNKTPEEWGVAIQKR